MRTKKKKRKKTSPIKNITAHLSRKFLLCINKFRLSITLEIQLFQPLPQPLELKLHTVNPTRRKTLSIYVRFHQETSHMDNTRYTRKINQELVRNMWGTAFRLK